MVGVGERIKNLRKANGLTQDELAGKLNVSRQAISSWEMDRTEPNMGMVFRMAKIFNCTIIDIAGTNGHEAIKTASPEETEVLTRYRYADEDTRRMVKRILSYVDKMKGDDDNDH